jgi:hypothetical protein
MSRLNVVVLDPGLLFFLEQLVDLGHELADILEFKVNRRKSQIGNLVYASEFGEQDLSDVDRLQLTFGALLDGLLDLIHYFLELGQADRPFLASFEKPVQDFVAVEPLSAAILLHYHVRYFIAPFIACEAPAAIQALASAAD